MYKLPPSHTPSPPMLPGDNGDFPFHEAEAGSLRDYWIVVRKYRWTILAFLLPVALIAAIAGRWPAPVYTASATILMENRSPNIVGVSEAFTATSGNIDQYYETQLNLLRSRSLAASVIQDLNLAQHPNFQRHPEDFFAWVQRQLRQHVRSAVGWVKAHLAGEAQAPVPAPSGGDEGAEETPPERFELGVSPHLINSYLWRLGARVIGESQVVSVSFRSVDPALARDIVNAHVSAFIRASLLTRFQLTAEARHFLEAKLVELKEDLEASEEALNEFRKTHAIVGLERGESHLVDRLRALNMDLTQARSKRIELEALYRTVQRRDNWLLSEIIDNPFVRQLKDQISGLEMERTRLATTFRPNHPGVAEIQQQINQVRGRMDQETRRIVRTIESDYGAAQAREAALAQEMEAQRQAVLELREKAVAAAVLERDVESNRSLYDNVLKRTKEANLTESVPIGNIRQIDPADTPLSADDTKATRTLLLSVLVGLLGGVGLSFLRYHLDNTVKTPEDIARFLRLPTLGMVPDIRRLDRQVLGVAHATRQPSMERTSQVLQGGDQALVPTHHPFSFVRESYQTICTGLLFSLPERPPKTILISSSQPKEGKTATAINIAHALAQHGAPVLLIDADLRNGHCHRLLGLDNEGGLSNALTGDRYATELIQRTAIANLSLLPRGPIPPNPTPLLASDAMRQMLEALKPDFSFIIIDSAPLLPINDSVLLATKVDGVVLVVQSQEVSRAIARQACDRLAYVKARVLGVILNGIDIRGPEYKDYRGSYMSYHASYVSPRQ